MIQASNHAHKNSFDLLRLIAALMVIVSHFYVNGQSRYKGFAPLGFYDIGNVALYMFFSISGYLVSISWIKDPNAARFMARRTLRIFPALGLVLAVTVFVIGPIFTDLGYLDFIRHQDTLAYMHNAYLSVAYRTLPGVFTGNVEGIVNGPLWTLRYEFYLYIFVMIFGLCGGFSHKKLSQGALILGLTIGIFMHTRLCAPCLETSIHQSLVDPWDLIIAFLAGACLASDGFADKGFKYILLAVFALSLRYVHMNYISAFVISYLTLYLGRRIKIDVGPDDYSYGLYLWGWLWEQMIFSIHPGLPNTVFLALATLGALACACASWHLVEKRALAMKPKRKMQSHEKVTGCIIERS